MFKKILALLVAFTVALNFFSVACAKTDEEKAAEKAANKEFKLKKKREKELAKIHRRTNIFQVEKWANNGDIQAQMILSYAYSTGQRIGHNAKNAEKWKDTATAGNSDLVENFIPMEYGNKKVNLPRLYGLAACRSQIGQYVEQNFNDAVRWAQLGASENDTLSLAILGSAYYTGRGIRQDYKKAVEFLKKAKDEPIALSLLSDAYEKGNGVDKDLETSRFYSEYLQSIVQPKIDKQRNKNQKKYDKQEQRYESKPIPVDAITAADEKAAKKKAEEEKKAAKKKAEEEKKAAKEKTSADGEKISAADDKKTSDDKSEVN